MFQEEGSWVKIIYRIKKKIGRGGGKKLQVLLEKIQKLKIAKSHSKLNKGRLAKSSLASNGRESEREGKGERGGATRRLHHHLGVEGTRRQPAPGI